MKVKITNQYGNKGIAEIFRKKKLVLLEYPKKNGFPTRIKMSLEKFLNSKRIKKEEKCSSINVW